MFKFNLITFLLAILPWYRHSVNMGNQRSSNKIETNFEKIQQKFINCRIQFVVQAYNFSVDHKCTSSWVLYEMTQDYSKLSRPFKGKKL